MMVINWEGMAKRLLALGDLGAFLGGADGHIWIQTAGRDYEENHFLFPVLRNAGISLNNKIYGGIFEALDTIDEALRMAGHDILLDYYDEDSMFLGNKIGPDMSRIDRKEKGKGGLY
jgi:hypothetical protein